MKTFLKKQLKALDINLSDKQIDKFIRYRDLILEWNKKMNLTAITEEKEMVNKHFIDCLALAKYTNLRSDASVIDIGTGAGFPGIPMKILYPDLKITLLDSLNKRITFLKTVVKDLELSDVELIHGRAEDFGQNVQYRERFDYTFSRAVASLNILSEYSLPFLKIGGKFIPMKSKKSDEEIENSKKALEILGGKLISEKDFVIPNTDLYRNVLIIEKIKKTPKKYPRRPGKPNKSPL